MSVFEVRFRLERAWDWLLGSDPGLLRLQMAVETVLTLAVSLLVLFLLTSATGQPLTVALLGVVIAMMSAMAINDPDPRQQRITMALLPLPAAVAVTLGAVLATHRVAGDVIFVAIMFGAVYARRFGGRGMALGMVAFMTYFFALFLGATIGQVPWLIGAVLVGAACSLGMQTYVFPDRPDRVLRRTLRALWARVRMVVELTAQALVTNGLDRHLQRRLAGRLTRVNETALMVDNQLEGKVDPAALWPGIDQNELQLRLFDVELAAERLATAGGVAASASDRIANGPRRQLVSALGVLRTALRGPLPGDFLWHAERRAEELRSEARDVPARDAGALAPTGSRSPSPTWPSRQGVRRPWPIERLAARSPRHRTPPPDPPHRLSTTASRRATRRPAPRPAAARPATMHRRHRTNADRCSPPTGCSRRPGRLSRWRWPARWRSSPVNCCRPPAGTGP